MITDDNDVIGKAIAMVQKQRESIQQNIGAKGAKEIKRKQESKAAEPKKKTYTSILKIASIVVCILMASVVYSFVFMPNIIKSIPLMLKNIDPVAIIKGGKPEDEHDFTYFKL